MKKAISILVFICMLLSTFALAEDVQSAEKIGFTFLDGAITWETTVDEAMAILGEGTQRADDSDDIVGTAVLLQSAPMNVFGCEALGVTLLFVNDQLCTIECTYEEDVVDDLDRLVDAANEVYGEGDIQIKLSLNDYLSSIMNEASNYCIWEGVEGTSIKLIDLDNGHDCCFQIENTAAWAVIQSILNQ